MKRCTKHTLVCSVGFRNFAHSETLYQTHILFCFPRVHELCSQRNAVPNTPWYVLSGSGTLQTEKRCTKHILVCVVLFRNFAHRETLHEAHPGMFCRVQELCSQRNAVPNVFWDIFVGFRNFVHRETLYQTHTGMLSASGTLLTEKRCIKYILVYFVGFRNFCSQRNAVPQTHAGMHKSGQEPCSHIHAIPKACTELLAVQRIAKRSPSQT